MLDLLQLAAASLLVLEAINHAQLALPGLDAGQALAEQDQGVEHLRLHGVGFLAIGFERGLSYRQCALELAELVGLLSAKPR